MNEEEYTKIIKGKVRKAAFNKFKHMQAGHEKGNTLYHEDLKHPQPYLITNKRGRVSLLFTMRTQCVRGIKDDNRKLFCGTKGGHLRCDV